MSTTEILEGFELTQDDVDEAEEFVKERIEFFDAVREVRTSRELPDGTFVHLHQLVVDNEGTPYVVTNLSHESIKLVEVEPPRGSERMTFLDPRTITYGSFCMNYDAKFVDDESRSGDRQPVFAW